MTRTSPAGSAGRGAAGYTLVELLVVLALLGLLTALASPLIGRGLQSEIRAAADAIGVELRAARGRAVQGNHDTWILVDAVSGSVSTDTGEVVAVLPERAVLHLVVADSERQSVKAGRIRFRPDGSSTGGRVTLHRDGHGLAVDVDWLDGRIEISDARPG